MKISLLLAAAVVFGLGSMSLLNSGGAPNETPTSASNEWALVADTSCVHLETGAVVFEGTVEIFKGSADSDSSDRAVVYMNQTGLAYPTMGFGLTGEMIANV